MSLTDCAKIVVASVTQNGNDEKHYANALMTRVSSQLGRRRKDGNKHFHKLEHVKAREKKIELCNLRSREEASFVTKCFVHFFAPTN
jgi:hypothetical protein